MKRVMFWTPRIICIAFAAFLAIFALDVFDMPGGFWYKALALVMHLIPAGMVLIVLAIAWRREWIGAVFFPLLAILHLVTKWGNSTGRRTPSSTGPCCFWAFSSGSTGPSGPCSGRMWNRGWNEISTNDGTYGSP